MQQCSRHDLYLGSQRGLMWSDAIRFLKLQTEAMQGRKLDHLEVKSLQQMIHLCILIYLQQASFLLCPPSVTTEMDFQDSGRRTKETRTHKQWNEKSRRTLEAASSDKLMQIVGEIRLTGLTGHRWKQIRVGQQIRKVGNKTSTGSKNKWDMQRI